MLLEYIYVLVATSGRDLKWRIRNVHDGLESPGVEYNLPVIKFLLLFISLLKSDYSNGGRFSEPWCTNFCILTSRKSPLIGSRMSIPAEVRISILYLCPFLLKCFT